MGIFDFLKREKLSVARSDVITFDANGRVAEINITAGKWKEKRVGKSCYFTQDGRSLLQATEILKSIHSIPSLTYYLVETPDGELGRDICGFYTTAPLKTSGLKMETSRPAAVTVECASLTAFGKDQEIIQAVAYLKSIGEYATLVLLMECGRCGYKSPVETEGGDFERQCYACGATNRCHRGDINVFVGSQAVQI